MSRALAALAAMGAGALAWMAWPRGAQAGVAQLPEGDGMGEPLPLPPPAAPPVPQRWTGGRLTPADVVALLPYADPDGWLPPAEVLAFVTLESSFNPEAYRFEPHLGEASYGLMQVLASTARDRGLNGPPEAMYDPLVSLRLGIAQARWGYEFLTRRLGREPEEHEWVGAYNAGVGNVLRGFIPWSYVRRWQAVRDRYAAGA